MPTLVSYLTKDKVFWHRMNISAEYLLVRMGSVLKHPGQWHLGIGSQIHKLIQLELVKMEAGGYCPVKIETQKPQPLFFTKMGITMVGNLADKILAENTNLLSCAGRRGLQ